MLRTEARIAGAAYLSYIGLAMTGSLLMGKATAGADAAEKLATLGRMINLVRATVLLDLLQTVCALVLAVTLYRLVNEVNPTVALLAMLFRLGEGLLGTLPLLGKLELMRLVAAAPAAGSSAVANYLALGNELLHRPDEVFSEFFFVVGGFLFACLLLQGRMVPRWLAWIGVVTIGVQLIFVPLFIAGLASGAVVNWLWMPILLYEGPLGLWLIVKGVDVPVRLRQ